MRPALSIRQQRRKIGGPSAVVPAAASAVACAAAGAPSSLSAPTAYRMPFTKPASIRIRS